MIKYSSVFPSDAPIGFRKPWLTQDHHFAAFQGPSFYDQINIALSYTEKYHSAYQTSVHYFFEHWVFLFHHATWSTIEFYNLCLLCGLSDNVRDLITNGKLL